MSMTSSSYLSDQVITYIGNKRSLLQFIGSGIDAVRRRTGKNRLTTFDVFSGSGVVARYMKGFSERISVCDAENYSSITNSCYLSNRSEVDIPSVRMWIDRMNEEGSYKPIEGVISKLYAPQDDDNIKLGERVFYTRRNAQFIDTARRVIDDAPAEIRPHLLAPLLYVASVHTNTSGVFKGFYKNSKTGVGQFGGNGKDSLSRIRKPFTVPYPVYSESECEYSIYHGDSNEIARTHRHVDVAYLDPPYNQHPYGSNYFMLNLIAENVFPDDISEVSGIPKNWNRSAYNKRHQARLALGDIVASVNAKFLIVSFNSEGFISRDEMIAMLDRVGKTEVIETKHNAFRGSRNLSNRGTYVTEYLYLVEKY